MEREISERKKVSKSYPDSGGYVAVYVGRDHPLANKRGHLREHRYVYHSQINSNPTACALCEAPITWKTLHIDHIDCNRANNAPENLRAVCRGCNVFRSHTATSMGKHFFEVNGVRMTCAAWARMPGVEVAGNTMMSRRARGMSDYDAIYAPRKNCQNIKTKKLKMIHDEMRGIGLPSAQP